MRVQSSHTIRLGLPMIVVLALVACGGGTAGDAPASIGSDGSSGAQQEGSAAAPGAGGSDEADGDGEGIDLCAVLSTEEVGEATGVEVTEATSAEAVDVSSCNYNSADGLPVAGTTYTRGNEAIDPEQMLEANAGGGGEEISDLGDRAVLVGDENFPIVMVLKGGALYSLSVISDELDAEAKRQASIDLARLSVDRLP